MSEGAGLICFSHAHATCRHHYPASDSDKEGLMKRKKVEDLLCEEEPLAAKDLRPSRTSISKRNR